jgi:hypothetical protein
MSPEDMQMLNDKDVWNSLPCGESAFLVELR